MELSARALCFSKEVRRSWGEVAGNSERDKKRKAEMRGTAIFFIVTSAEIKQISILKSKLLFFLYQFNKMRRLAREKISNLQENFVFFRQRG
jgi:hypothetical protein